MRCRYSKLEIDTASDEAAHAVAHLVLGHTLFTVTTVMP
jgi:hypothetical protein